MKNTNWKRALRAVALAATLGFGAGLLGQAGLPSDAQAQDPGTESSAGHVNLNTATEAQLTLLPGIGPSKAQAIIRYREQVRQYRRPEDLMRVRGIGRATFRRLRALLTVEGATTLTAAPPRASASTAD